MPVGIAPHVTAPVWLNINAEMVGSVPETRCDIDIDARVHLEESNKTRPLQVTNPISRIQCSAASTETGTNKHRVAITGVVMRPNPGNGKLDVDNININVNTRAAFRVIVVRANAESESGGRPASAFDYRWVLPDGIREASGKREDKRRAESRDLTVGIASVRARTHQGLCRACVSGWRESAAPLAGIAGGVPQTRQRSKRGSVLVGTPDAEGPDGARERLLPSSCVRIRTRTWIPNSNTDNL
ncbi:hypothetical protein B0H10DRAFT_2193952 [Mycena sp. CBHHK59/15]|nr:hypothetical protein B0H10DRAFT_2193952 [Mycena sp. CBHHK59/15]